jgi:hypothetical protein
MTLVKVKNVKARFTYKELTLVLGIFVALIVAFTLWNGGNDHIVNGGSGITPTVTIPATVNFVLKSISAVWL